MGRQMELDSHMQMDFGGAPQNYWGPRRRRPPGAEVDADEEEDDAADMTPAQVLPQ